MQNPNLNTKISTRSINDQVENYFNVIYTTISNLSVEHLSFDVTSNCYFNAFLQF